ncbi:hypothetical protein IKF25_03510 [Candidatus Saccharibacteria bacterium]|nr:hypothetical protein [Candidatus Saccharibacteria bacterium]
MKKFIVSIIIVTFMILAMPAQAYACDCPCCNKNKTTQTNPSSKSKKKVSLKAAADKEIKSLAKIGKKYGWTVESKKVVKNANGKYYVRVKFVNKAHNTYSNLILHSVKKNGKAQVSWHFKDLQTGKLKNTTAKLIETMFKSVNNKK